MLIRHVRLAAVTVLAVLPGLALGGCGSSSDEADAPSSAPTVTETASVPAGATPTTGSSAPVPTVPAQGSSGAAGSGPSVAPGGSASPGSGAPTAASAPLRLGSTIRDNGLGHTIVVERAVRNFPAPKSSQGLVDQGDELVLVEVKVTAGTKYYVTVGQDDFVFGVDGSSYPGMSMATDDIKKAMRKAGYPPLADVDAGSSGEGWVAGFVRPAGSPKAYVGYRRLAYQVSGGGSIPAKTWKVTLPLG